MPRFRKKPVVIEAWLNELGSIPPAWLQGDADGGSGGVLLIPTLEGVMSAQPGDWIIKGVKGEIYPCKPDIFAATYDLAEESEDTAEDMPDIMRERHPDGSGGVKTLATFTAKPRTCQGTYDEVMAARQRVYVENLGVRTPRT